MTLDGVEVALIEKSNRFINFYFKILITPITAVDELKKKLVAVGFQELKEFDTWNVKPLDKVSQHNTKLKSNWSIYLMSSVLISYYAEILKMSHVVFRMFIH